MKIYHNPRCRKSREGLAILQDAKIEPEIIDYIKNPISFEELADILRKLDIPAIDLVRKNEAIWKEQYRGKELSETEVLKVMEANPKLMERPLVVKGKKAVLGRPPENVLSLLNQG